LRVSRIPKDNRGTMIVDGKPVGLDPARTGRTTKLHNKSQWRSFVRARLFAARRQKAAETAGFQAVEIKKKGDSTWAALFMTKDAV
jgi:hypothetical protein